MWTNDGGLAFPRAGGEFHGESPGMTLRDYFAAKAMAPMIGSLAAVCHGYKEVARLAYEIADAMLKAREPQP